jgi:hypothetical protein
MRVRVACALYKLVHGASLLICSKLFAMGKSTVSTVLHDVVHAVNTEFALRYHSREDLGSILSCPNFMTFVASPE